MDKLKCKLCGELVDDFLLDLESHLENKHDYDFGLESNEDESIDNLIYSYFESVE